MPAASDPAGSHPASGSDRPDILTDGSQHLPAATWRHPRPGVLLPALRAGASAGRRPRWGACRLPETPLGATPGRGPTGMWFSNGAPALQFTFPPLGRGPATAPRTRPKTCPPGQGTPRLRRAGSQQQRRLRAQDSDPHGPEFWTLQGLRTCKICPSTEGENAARSRRLIAGNVLALLGQASEVADQRLHLAGSAARHPAMRKLTSPGAKL